MSKFEDRLWRDLVRKHGADLAQMATPPAKRARRGRPRLVAGTTVSLAGIATAVVLLVSAAGSPPAFAVNRNSDGTYTVTIQRIGAIRGANARLAALGIRARLVVVASGCTVKALPPAAVQAMKLAQSMAGKASPQVAVAKLDPGQIPPGRWQVIPTYRVAGSVHVDKGHLIQGEAPACFSTVAAPPCQREQVYRNGRLMGTTPAEPGQALKQFLAKHPALNTPAGNSGSSGNSGNSGDSGDSGNSGSSGNS